MSRQRVTFYVDGFNFYYGLKGMKRVNPEWRRFYWIDVVKLFSQFLGPEQELEKVIYFTASPLDPDKSSRQSAFLNANSILHPDTFRIVRGKYINKNISCPHCGLAISRPEEKKTDVNLSVSMMGDCFRDATDVVALVSADTDLIPPLSFILDNFKDKTVKVYFPPTHFSYDIATFMRAHKCRIIHLENNIVKFRNAVMSDTVTDGTRSATIPDLWK